MASRAAASGSKTRSVQIPPQAVPAIDAASGQVNKTWWLALKEQNTLVNSLAAASGGSVAGTFIILAIASNQVTPDISLGLKFLLTLNQSAAVTVENPVNTGGTIVAGNSFDLYVVMDATGYRPQIAFGLAFGQDVVTQVLKGDPNTRSVYRVTFHPDNLWHLDAFQTGNPLS